MNKAPYKQIKLMLHSRPILCTEYSVDGQYIFSAGQDSIINILCAYTGKVLDKYGPHATETGAAIKSISVTSDSRYIAVGLNYNQLIVHDRQDKKNQIKINIQQKGIRVVQFTKDSKYLFTFTTPEEEDGSMQSKLIKYSFPDMKIVKETKMEADCQCCILSPDDKQLWVGTKTSLKMFNTETLEELFDEDYNAPINDLQLYKNAFVVVPLSEASIVYFYSMRTCEDVYSIKVGNRVNTAAVNEFNNILVIGGGLDPKLVALVKEGNNVLTQFYDLQIKDLIQENEIHSGPTHKLRWSPDGQGLVTASQDGSLAILRFGREILDYKFDSDWV